MLLPPQAPEAAKPVPEIIQTQPITPSGPPLPESDYQMVGLWTNVTFTAMVIAESTKLKFIVNSFNRRFKTYRPADHEASTCAMDKHRFSF